MNPALDAQAARFHDCAPRAIVSPCTTSGPYSLSGCVPVICSAPPKSNGYIVDETELSLAAGFDVSATCATNYEGTAAARPAQPTLLHALA